MNKVIIMGNLVRDPEARQTTNGKNCTTFTVAVNRSGDGTDFIPCTAWNKQAETAGRYLRKGTKVLVEGTLRQSTWEKTPGEKITRFDVWVDRFEFAEKKQDKPDMTPADDDDAPLPF